MNVALIPARGGSKSIPYKNIKQLCGKPLLYWSTLAACKNAHIDFVYISTDSDVIRHSVEEFCNQEDVFSKVRIIGRSMESASDTATTESVMLEFAADYEFDNIVLIQATSPLLTVEDLEHGFELFEQDKTDSVLSVVPQKRFLWTVGSEGCAKALNYDIYRRPRRQEFDGYYVENGAFYITTRKSLLESKNRLSGRIKICPMSEDTFLEIDEPEDWTMIECLLSKRLQNSGNPDKTAENIKMFLTDCDGCLTDGGMYYSNQGDEIKKFNTLDGMGFRMLKERGVICGIITGEKVHLVERRAEKLKLDILETGVQNKLPVIKGLCEKYQIPLSQVAYMGDDVNDVEALQHVGLSFSVPNGVEQARYAADIVTARNGGEGAVREAADYILSHLK